jgi:integrase
MARRTLTDASIAALKPRAQRYAVADPKLPGHYVRVTPTGAKSFAAVTRDPRGKQVWHTIGSTAVYRLDQARELARTAIQAIKAGESRAGPQTFEAVAEQWVKRHVEAKGLRSASRVKRRIERQIIPEWKSRDFQSITRSDVTALLDRIEDGSGPVAADKALSIVSAVFNWYASRHDRYSSPIVRGMRRSNSKERARKRILSDEEIYAVWKRAKANGTFGAFVRLLLLTGQRKDKVATIKWNDLSADSTWIIKTEAREKGNAGELVLPQVALDIINAQPRLADNPYVFAGRRSSPMTGLAQRKDGFCAKLPTMPHWTLHDLRRTARSLMTRAGISSEVAERVLGHAIGGVEGIYNQHQYREEKAHALRALASLIESIVNPPADNVVSLARGAVQ